MAKKKLKGNVIDRFEAAVECGANPHYHRQYHDLEVHIDRDSCSAILYLGVTDIGYSKYFSRGCLQKAEKEVGLVYFAREEISIGVRGIRLIEYKSPFKGNERQLAEGGEWVVYYSHTDAQDTTSAYDRRRQC